MITLLIRQTFKHRRFISTLQTKLGGNRNGLDSKSSQIPASDRDASNKSLEQTLKDPSTLNAHNAFRYLNDQVERGDRSVKPLKLFDRLKELDDPKYLPLAFEPILKYYQYMKTRDKVRKIIALVEDYEKLNIPMSQSFYSNTINYLLSVPEVWESTFFYLKMYYLKYRHQYNLNGNDVYIALFKLHCQFGDGFAVDILSDMVKARCDPSPKQYIELLNAALLHNEIKVLRILANWSLKVTVGSFHEINLEYGQLSRMLQVAGGAGDAQLASTVFQLMEKNKYNIMGEHYYALIVAFAKSGDVAGTVEAILDMYQKSLVFSTIKHSQQTSVYSVKRILIQMLIEQSKQNGGEQFFDHFYSALVEQAQNGIQIPSMLIEALLEGLGVLGFTDRAFSTFQELHSVFNLRPSVELYNALMAGCAANDKPESLNEVISVFHDLENLAKLQKENADCVPNEESYTILFEALIAHDAVAAVTNLLKVSKSLQAFPRLLTLRRVAFLLAKNNKKEELDEILSMINIRNQGLTDALSPFLDRVNELSSQVKRQGEKRDNYRSNHQVKRQGEKRDNYRSNH